MASGSEKEPPKEMQVELVVRGTTGPVPKDAT
jgi:hypothetical protein